jgi:PAS domain S-box-containing protein
MQLPPEAAHGESAALRVLILEDSASDAGLIVRALQASGHAPLWTRVWTEEDFRMRIGPDLDVIIADYTLPQFDAVSALEILRAEGLSIPFIIVSGTITEETAVTVLKHGADDFLLKDRLARLGPAVAGALQQQRLREDRRRARQLLAENEERYRRLITRMSALVIELDPEGTTLYVNETVSAVTGFSPGELLGRNALDLLLAGEARDQIEAAAGIVLHGEDLRNYVTRCRTKDGSLISLEWSTANEYGAGGRLRKITALGIDISEREAAAQRIRQLSRLYAAISRTNEALVRSQTPDEVFAAVCRACVEHGGFALAWVGLADRQAQRIVAAHAFGPAIEHVAGLNISIATGRGPANIAYRERRVFICNDIVADPTTAPWRARAVRHGLAAAISLPICRGGEAIGALLVYATQTNVFEGEAVSVLEKMAENISFAMDKFAQEAERKRLAEERLEDARRMAELSRRAVTVQEDERRKLAAELHDRTSPNLSAVALNLAMMAEDLPPKGADSMQSRLTDNRALLEETITAIRDVCADLRPATLDYVGLFRALQEYAQQFSHRTGIAVEVSGASPEARLAPDKETALFRIAQEALTNCAKHAKASAVRIELSHGSPQAVLTIADNGAGFDPGALGQSGSRPGLGLLSMRERAEFAGGKLTLESLPGKGTQIRVEV